MMRISTARPPARRSRSETGSHDAYLARKAREIALIQRCIAPSAPVDQPASAEAAMAEKFRLAAQLRAARSLQSWAITETARPEVQRWRVGAWRFAFGYQRADLTVRGPAIYDVPRVARGAIRSETFYTGSGMSAIAATAAALLRVRGELEIVAPRGCYNETRELLASLRPQVSVVSLPDAARAPKSGEGRMRVLLIDSSVSTGFHDFHRSPPVDAVLVDTTCFAQSSARIRGTIERAVKLGTPMLLVRSHAKLDSLGVEYGRLGSIVLLRPRADAQREWIEALPRAIADAVRLYGVAAIPAHFPPFSGTDEYRECSRARTASIMRSTRRMQRRLTEVLPGRSVRRFQHALYLALVPDRDFALKDVKRLAGDLCSALAHDRLPVKHAGSFGFDFVAVEWFFDPVLRRNLIRVAGADLPAAIVDRIVDGIERWWARHRMSPVQRPAERMALYRELTMT
jgi:hypothetical protein